MRGSQPWKTNRSRILRSAYTSAEDRLWQVLRGRRLGRVKFVRQAPVGKYYADFLCRERRLIVEVDGATHCTDAERMADARRSAELERLGYVVFRVTNADVRDNLEGICETLLAHLEGREVDR